MCGIAGIISPHAALVQQQTLATMANTLRHRGPDGEGFWINDDGCIGLAHRRLSIIDLTPGGVQPMHYLHYTIIFNGEIYNYIELKDALQKKGYIFTTATDTEVITAAYDCWGVDCLNHFDGMFAFALWDGRERRLILARDRFGEKPLYYHADYAQRGKFDRFLFASEMKALWAAGVPKHLNGTMVLNYITLGYLQDPIKPTATFYNNILLLPPGHYLTVQPQAGRVQMKRWHGGRAMDNGQWATDNGQMSIGNRELSMVNGESPDNDLMTNDLMTSPKSPISNEKEAEEQFVSLLETSIKRRLRSDVAIGTSLSGGLDSSSIVALCNGMKAPGLTHECFTAVFPGFEKDEYAFSKITASQFNLRQHIVEVTAGDWISNFNTLMYHQEEPLQSSSVLAQYMVYGLAKQKGITVLLDGQGADEILGGYKKYPQWHLQQLLSTDVAAFMREKNLLRKNLLLENWGIGNYAAAFFPEKAALQLQRRAAKKQLNDDGINPGFLKKFQNIDTLQKPVVKKLEDILYYNTFTQGLQELLRYADRNSMAHSREVRLPFLYHELVEFVFSLPAGYKIRDGFTKWILRKSMQQKLPAEIVWRKDKVGFEPPQRQWMQHPAATEMIMEARKKLVNENVLDNSVIKKPVAALPAHNRHNSDWRYLCTASLF